MRRRTSRKVAFDSKVVIDVGLASLMTRIFPILVNNFVPLDTTLYSVVGAGGSYLAGTLMKKPVLANAGIALGLTELIAPVIEDLVGGFGGGAPPVAPWAPMPPGKGALIKQAKDVKLADFMNLNDYISEPFTQTNLMYRDSY